MENLTLTEWSDVANVVIALFTIIGIIVSLYFSRKALKEVQKDREHSQRPWLAFEGGGYRIPIHFVKAGKRIPGKNPEYVEAVLASLPDEAESNRFESITEDGDLRKIGKLVNYGVGTALEAEVLWIPKTIKIGSEEFEIDERKLAEPLYSEALNTSPAVPENILPKEESGLTGLPAFIEKDFQKKISEVEGVLEITYRDTYNKIHTTKQLFFMATNYQEKDNGPWIHVTFRDVLC